MLVSSMKLFQKESSCLNLYVVSHAVSTIRQCIVEMMGTYTRVFARVKYRCCFAPDSEEEGANRRSQEGAEESQEGPQRAPI